MLEAHMTGKWEILHEGAAFHTSEVVFSTYS